MKAGIVVNVTPDDRHRLEAIVGNRNAPQKHVLRCKNHPCHRRRLQHGRDLAAIRQAFLLPWGPPAPKFFMVASLKSAAIGAICAVAGTSDHI
jgi:hypothetical protein